MKKLVLFLLFVTGMLTAHATSTSSAYATSTGSAHAEDYAYLTFEMTDGAKVSVSVSSMTITISGTTLKTGNQSFTLSNLNKMYFTTSDETSGIKTISTEELNEVSEVYDLNGRKVSKDQMKKGVYVIKSKRGTYKIAVK